jgi:hypothetical protein
VNPKAETILFLHIPKTAGTTVSHFFEGEFDTNRSCTQPGLGFLREHVNLSSRATCHHRVISGHMTFGVHQSFDHPCVYITLLREPTDRIVSFYYYARRSPQMYLHSMAMQLSLEEFVASRDSLEFDNLQVRVLTGRQMAPFGSLTSADLECAIDNLRGEFDVVGAQDDVAGFLRAVCARFGFRYRQVPAQNVTKRRPSVTTVSLNAKALIWENNALDIKLYAYAKAHLFHKTPAALTRAA